MCIGINPKSKLISSSCLLLNRLSSFFSYGINTIPSAKSKWIDIMNRLIEREGLTNIVIHHTPLIDFDIDSVKGKWYDISNVNLDSDFDMFVIDGPPSYKKGLQLSRYPAISLIQNKLKKDGVFYMDDFRRTGEVEVLKKWQQKIKLNPGKKNLYGKGQIYFK